MKNEAAERLGAFLIDKGWSHSPLDNLNEALAAERAAGRAETEAKCVARGHLTGADIGALEKAASRATAERIRERIGILPEYTGDSVPILEAMTKILESLDEEANR